MPPNTSPATTATASASGNEDLSQAWAAAEVEADKIEQAYPSLAKLEEETAPAKDGKPRGADGKFSKGGKEAAPAKTNGKAAGKGAAAAAPKEEPVADATEVETTDTAEPTEVETAGTDEPEPDPGDETEPEPEAAAADDDTELTPEEERATLEALAEKYGYTISDTKISPQEREGFREEKRRFREGRTQFEQSANAFIDRIAPISRLLEARGIKDVPAMVQRLEPLLKALDSYDAGDLDGALKLALGRTLTEINEDALSMGPHWKAMRQIQIERDKDKAEREAERAELAQAKQQREQAAAREHESQYLRTLQGQLAQDKDPVIAALAKTVPQFVEQIHQLQIRHYDPDDKTTISVAEAARQSLEDYRKGYETLRTIFGARDSTTRAGDQSTKVTGGTGSPQNRVGGQPTTEAERPRNGTPPKRTAPTQQARRQAGRRDAPHSDAEWLRRAQAMLAAADD